jgi:RNA polymerase sigma factor (sigma-70 family)
MDKDDLEQIADIACWQVDRYIQAARNPAGYRYRVRQQAKYRAQERGRGLVRWRETPIDGERLEYLSGLHDSAPSPEDLYLVEEQAGLVRAALAKLPNRQRLVMTLKYYNGYMDSEIADMLGCTTKMVGYEATRARKTLRALLEEEEGELCVH